MLYYMVKKEYDQKPRMKYGRGGVLERYSVYIGGELFTPKEVEKEYKTHRVGMPKEQMFEAVNVSRKSVYWSFGTRKSTALA